MKQDWKPRGPCPYCNGVKFRRVDEARIISMYTSGTTGADFSVVMCLQCGRSELFAHDVGSRDLGYGADVEFVPSGSPYR
jgi:hypothetical protein